MNDNSAQENNIRKMIEDLAGRYDKDRMSTVIKRIPDQIEIALERPMPGIPGGPFDKVLLVGMGGSALPMDVIIDLFDEQLKKVRPNIFVLRNYELPLWINDKTLIIASSFSGATEEVLIAIQRFPREASNIAVISRELKNDKDENALSKMANERGYPLIEIPVNEEPPGFQPRSAVGYMVTFIARLLFFARVMEDPIPQLQTIPGFLRRHQEEIRSAAENAARFLSDKIPVVYTDESHLNSVARITKIKFNENSKRPAFFNALPEMNHNEMIGFTKSLGNFGILYFHDSASHPRIQRRYEVMKKIFHDSSLDHVNFHKWEMIGTTKLQKVFSALVFADWCSYTLALFDKFNPTPVELVEAFKKALVSEDLSQ